MKIIQFILILCFQYSFSQVTFQITQLPENRNDYENIYLSGDFEGWSGGQAAYQLSNKNELLYITIPEQSEAIHFKFTKGSWDTVEVDANGNQIEDRIYQFKNQPDTLNIQIANWSEKIEKKSTATKNVTVLSEDFNMPQLENRERRIWVYVPPDYETSQKKYPVLYMHDGQNLFDELSSFSGEWQVDESLNQLFKDNNLALIVIGIDNGGDKRLEEYSPWKNEKYGGGKGDLYLEFIVKTLKPFVDKNYRTKADKKNTGLMGSSMGGLISHYGALKYPETFGKIGVFSPAFWFSIESFPFAETNSKLKSTKMYFLAGDEEGEGVIPDMEKMQSIMHNNGFNSKKITSKIVHGGKHNEDLWRKSFPEAVLWLFEI